MKAQLLFMIKRYKTGFLPTLFLLFAFPVFSFAYTDGVALKVNSEIITFSEFNGKVNSELKRNGISKEDKAKVKKIKTAIVKKMVDDILVKDQAIEKEIVVEDEEVNKSIENIKKKNNISEDVFAVMLENQGVTNDEYREQIRDQILSSRIINEEVNSKIIVNDEDVKAYYEANKSTFLTEPEIEVEHILLTLKADAPPYEHKAVLERINGIREQIIQGTSFEVMAAQYSQDPSKGETGSIGFIKRGVTVPPFENAAFALPIGEISEPVRSPFGIHLIKVLSKKPQLELTYEEALPQAKNVLFKKAFRKHYEEWMKKVKANAFLEFSHELSKQIDPIGGEKTFEAVGVYQYPISRRERARIGKKNYRSVEEKRKLAKETNTEKQGVDLKPELLEKVKFYKRLFDKGLISKKEYLKKINSLELN